jgi:hypothetical protein
MIKVFVYGLADPRDGEIRYIGITNAPYRRWYAHCKRPSNVLLAAWLLDLRHNKTAPVLVVFCSVRCKNIWRINHALKLEKRYIKHYLSLGYDLLNLQHTDVMAHR